MHLDIESLLPWTAGKLLNTARGPRLLRTSAPTPEFEKVWYANKDWLVANGVSFGRAYRDKNKYEACWWADPPADVTAKREEALEHSHATNAEIDIPIPAGLEYRPYQKAGIRYGLSRPGVLFGDEMGLGKTIQAIGVLNSSPDLNKGLVICPTSVKVNWYREMRRFLTRPLQVWIAEPHIYPRADIVIINPHLLKKFERFLIGKEFDFIILDEAHNLRNPKTIAAKVVFGYHPTKNEKAEGQVVTLPLSTKKRMALTGTPILNKVEEIFPILHWLVPSHYKNMFQFGYSFLGHNPNSNGQVDYKRLQEDMRTTCMIRRLKNQVEKDLPAKTREVLEFESDSPDVRQEREMWERGEERRAELEAKIEIAKAMGNRTDFEAYAAELGENIKCSFTEMAEMRVRTAKIKLPFCIEYIKDCISNGQKIVSFAHHRFMIETLHKEIKRSVIHYGGMSTSDKQIAVDRFQQYEDCMLFSGSLGASREGITLTASWHVVFCEFDWRPGYMSQAGDRVHRIGQTRAVTESHTVLKDSLDVNMVRALITKQEIADLALDDADRAQAYLECASTDRVSIGAREYQTAAAKINDDQVKAIYMGIQQIVANQSAGTAGFNRADAKIIEWLSKLRSFDKRQSLLGLKLVTKYQKQIPEELLDQAKGLK